MQRRDYSRMFGELPHYYSYEPSREMSKLARNLPASLRRFSIELAVGGAIAFAMSLMLASQSGDLKEYRAHFLSAGRDWSAITLLGWTGFRLITMKRQK